VSPLLGNGSHASAAQTPGKRGCQGAHGFRPPVKRPVADNIANTAVKIDAGCKTQIDARSTQLRGNQPASLARQPQRRIGIVVVFDTEVAHGRYQAESIPKSLYATTLVIHGDE
jgi:hypothetical protein